MLLAIPIPPLITMWCGADNMASIHTQPDVENLAVGVRLAVHTVGFARFALQTQLLALLGGLAVLDLPIFLLV